MSPSPVPDIAIRPYAPEDFERVAALMIELQEFERGITPYRVPADREFAAWYVARLLRGLDEAAGTLLVATDGTAPCGYAAGHPQEEPEMRDRFFYVAELAVAATY